MPAPALIPPPPQLAPLLAPLLAPQLAPQLATGGVGGMALGLGAMLLLALAGLGVVAYLRKRTLADDAGDPSGGGGFTLSDLRRLHRAGEMTDEEFERARSAMVAGYQKRAESAAATGATPPASDPGDAATPTRLERDDFH